MSLDKQIHIYSFDTSAFYTDEERRIERAVNDLTYRKYSLKSEQSLIKDVLDGVISQEKAEKKYRTLYRIDMSTPI